MTFVKELTLDEAVSSPLFITVIGGFISFFCVSALEEQTKQSAQRISNSIK
jgi:hypothetical protein